MSDTIKMIKGWADGITATREPNEIASITLFTDKRLQELRPALLLVSTDDKVPEVMTMDDVRALLIEVRNDYILDDDKEWLNQCAAKHGITI